MPFICKDDWGSWLQTVCNGFLMGPYICFDLDADPDPEQYALMPSIQESRPWSWSRFRWIDHSQDARAIIEALESIFTSSADIHPATRHDDHHF